MNSVRSIRSGWFLVFVSFVVGCSSGQNANELRSLDAFSGGFQAEGQRCSAKGITVANIASHNYAKSNIADKIKPAVALPQSQKDSLKQLALVSLTAVPQQLVTLFFSNGDIRITPDATSICADHTKDVQTRGIAGCFVAITENNKVRFSIIADATESAVGGTIVRSFGYWVSQHLSTFASDGDITYKQSTPNKAFVANQRKVAKKYFEDIVARQLFDLSHFESLLGQGAANQIKTNVKGSVSDPLAGVTFNTKEEGNTRDERRAQFESYIFAEAFDSFFCNAHAPHAANQTYAGNLVATLKELRNTNLVMRDLFRGTWTMFGGVIDGLLSEVDTYLAHAKAKQKAGNSLRGFALADGSSTPGTTTTTTTSTTTTSTTTTTTTPAVSQPTTTATPATSSGTENANTNSQPVVTGNPTTTNPDAVTIIIDAQGQDLDKDNIQVVAPNDGLNQDIDIQIINQQTAQADQTTPPASVEVGGVQPTTTAADTGIVPPPTNQPVTQQPVTQQPIASQTTEQPTTQPVTTQPVATQPVVEQQPQVISQPSFPPQTGQVQEVQYPELDRWPGYDNGGYYGGSSGGYGGYGGCG